MVIEMITKNTQIENLHAQIKVLQFTVERDLGFIYESLDKRYDELRISEKKKKLTLSELNKDLSDLLEEYRTLLIVDFCDLLLDTIRKKNKHTQDFGEYISTITQIKKQTQESVMDRELYEKYYEQQLPELALKIRSRLRVDFETKKLFWKGIVLGGLFGFILGLIGSLLLYLLGFS